MDIEFEQAAHESRTCPASNWSIGSFSYTQKKRASGKPKLAFDVGQGSQDLGFRNEVDILFTITPSAKVTFRVLDADDKPTTGSFLIRDERQRVYPSQTKRLAPDFFFHPQVYRADGESVALPPGGYTSNTRAGPSIARASKRVESRGHRAAHTYIPAGALDRSSDAGMVFRRSPHSRGRMRAL